jgi:SagB-type dehydrogenase family enzyme
MSKDELSFLLWATQGVHRVNDDRTRSWRTVPSGGARHPFKTYLAVNNVEGLKKGVYRYLALSHRLLFLHEIRGGYEAAVTGACAGQGFVSKTAALFV